MSHSAQTTVPLYYFLLLRIIKKQLQPYTAHGMAMEQAGLRKGHVARDQIANVSVMASALGAPQSVNLFYRLHKGF
jgi:hypothetical protein